MNLKHITIHQMRLFHSLATHLSFTAVAKELHLSQSGVSIQIKRLAESVGIPLVEKVGKKIFLTEAGKELFEATDDVLNRLELLNSDIQDMGKTIKGPLRLSAITTSKYFMPHLLGRFLKDHPEVEPALTITNQSKVGDRLAENLDDIFIMGTLPQNISLEAYYFLDNPLVVVAPKDHPFANEKNIPLSTIANERFISREQGSGTRACRARLFQENNLRANTYMELGSAEAIKQAVMAGLGISVLSLHNLKLELEAGLLTVLDVQHFPITRKWYAVHLKNKRLSCTAQKFLEFLIDDGTKTIREETHKQIEIYRGLHQ
ncbi:MAG: RuBisCO operon transcriptional regulator CbbR [uncultured Thiotrichaceae bacterium]|uniref:RuBisCO operon transcriptional regulator CbbR n=1 Tax=uncultured Thiotrichaceae bacterium TaxID=298394 RepID=A0A6S6U4H4_9GAMM|nr:MAG: RuBisCO operon transcriptional regulator CbbR [uncultured Thiotrichaceae bacterium]